jgi:inorganic pyrophosphatase
VATAARPGDGGEEQSVHSATVDVLVEVPMGSRNKYELDLATGAFRLDRMLFSAVAYPGDYGFIPDTLARDGDPLDAIVILGEPTFPGCLIRTRVLGVLDMEDEHGPDEKVLGVVDTDPRWRDLVDLDDVPRHLRDEITHFFRVYKDLEPKHVAVRDWHPRQRALEVIADSVERFAAQA